MLPIFTFQAALCALVILEACRDVTTVDVRVCDYVIFDLDYAQLERSFWISWHKGNKSTQRWTYDNTRHGQNIRVFPNGTLGLRVVGKEDAGWYTATVCNSSQHCLYQSKFQLRVHGHLVRGHVGDCVTFDLNCVQSVRYIHIMWKKENQRVAKIRQAENAPVIYCNRAHVFPNGSLSRCPTQWGDEGEYVAEVYDEDGFHLHQETFNLELHRVETFKEITEFIGGSMFLNLTETKLKHFFQVVWKKENREIAWTNGSWVWYHEEYCNRSEIVSNYSLRLDRIQKRDRGRYSIEANDRNGRTVYECIANVKVEQKETFGRNPLHVPFYILIVSLGVVTITVLVALIWHFQKHKDRSDDRDNPEEDKEREENSPCSQNGENLSVQGLDRTNFTEQKTNDLLRNNKEANPATADKVMYSVVSRFQDGERPKLPGLKSMKSVKPQASVNEAYVAPNIEKTTRPESEHCNPHGFEDCFSPDFDHSIPPVLDGCTPAEFSWCSPPGLEDLKDDYLPSGSTASCKCSEGDMSSQYAVVKSTRGLPEDKPGDSVCSSSH